MLFLIGVLGFFLKRNIITLLLSVEIMLNAVNLTFVAFSSQHGLISGQILFSLCLSSRLRKPPWVWLWYCDVPQSRVVECRSKQSSEMVNGFF